MSEVVVVAVMEVAADQREAAVSEFAKVIEATHANEEGCLTYALHRDRGNPNRLVLVERWRSQEDLDAHFQQPHMATAAELADALVAPPEVIFCEPIPHGDPAKNLARA